MTKKKENFSKKSPLSFLVTGLAHEINNPLGAMLQAVQNIERRLDPNFPKNKEVAAELGFSMAQVAAYCEARGIPKFLSSVQLAGGRMGKIVKNLLQFSQPNDQLAWTVFSFPHLCDRVIDLLTGDEEFKTHLAGTHRIHIQRDYEPNTPPVEAISGQVAILVVHLLKNAFQAVLANQIHHPKRTMQVKIGLEHDRHHVVLRVQDNGMGMSEAVQKQIFNPFFTTHEPGEGRGLGLWVCYNIATEVHRGEISVQSELGQGCTVTVKFPLPAHD